jgi:hypothetical protein
MAEPESTITGDKPKKKVAPAKKSKAPSASDLEAAAYKKLSGQVSSDMAKEKGSSGSKLDKLSAQVSKDIKGESALTATGMGHPDAKALIAAGIPESTVSALAKAYAPSHPAANPAYAAATTGSNKGTGVTSDPTDPAQYAADTLLEAGLPDTADNEKLLEDQMTEEGVPGSENNPLATSRTAPNSTSVNSDGVQAYPTLAEGATAESETLTQPNMSSIYNALKSGTATPQQYAAALANSDYEGDNPSANAAYANSFLTDAGDPTTQFNTASPSTSDPELGTDALAQASGTNLFSGLNSTIPSLGTQSATSSLQSALQGIGGSASQATLQANTSDAPGSPDQTNSQTQQTTVNPASTYQAQLAALLGKNVQAGTAGKSNG